MFWKTNETKVSKELLKLVEILEVKVAKLDAQVEMINIKLKKKVYKDVPKEDDPNPETDKFNYNDGFDEIRKINDGSSNIR